MYNKAITRIPQAMPPAQQALKNTTSYDELMYPSKPFSQTSIYALEARATLLGLQPAQAKYAKVLELGCAMGGNIISQALYNPDAQFTGIDLSGKQISQGNAIIEQMGLKNVRLENKNILDIDKTFGKFDYIIVHGIWSWVPDNVKDKIFSICRNNLSEHGIAYISYNVYPGWKRVEQMRDIMLFASKNIPADRLLERTQQGLHALHTLANIVENDSGVEKYIGTKLNTFHNVLQADSYYVAHEYMEEFNQPIYVNEFIEWAMRHKLSYISDTLLSMSFTSWMAENTHRAISDLAGDDHIAKELYNDILFDAQFRRSLLCRQSQEKKIIRNEGIPTATLESLYFRKKGETPLQLNTQQTLLNALHHFIETRAPFKTADVMAYLNAHYPGVIFDRDRLNAELLLHLILDHLEITTAAPPKITFENHRTYVPARFTQYVAAFVEGEAAQSIGAANCYNEMLTGFEYGHLYIMRKLAAPCSKQDLIDDMNENLNITRTTPDGLQYPLQAEHYLEEILADLTEWGFLKHH